MKDIVRTLNTPQVLPRLLNNGAGAKTLQVRKNKSEKAKKLTSFKTKIQSAKVTELNDGRILLVFSTRVKIDETPVEGYPDKTKAVEKMSEIKQAYLTTMTTRS